MEKQQGFQKCSDNVQIIKRIQNNLFLLKSKINFLTRQENQTTENIFKSLDCTTSLISKKLNQIQQAKAKVWVGCESQNQQNKRTKWVSIFRDKSMSIMSRRQQSRSNLIREQSKKNQEKIVRQMQNSYMQKKKHYQKVKGAQSQSRRKISQFHLLKKFHIRKQKRNQQQVLKTRALKALEQLKKTENEKANIQQKVQANKFTLKSIDDITKYMEIMEKEQVIELASKFKIHSPEKLTDKKIKNILIFVNEQIKYSQKKKNKENNAPQRAKSFVF